MFTGIKVKRIPMEKCWDYFNPPKPVEEIQKSYVACIYASKIPHLLTGCVTKKCLNYADDIYTLALEVDCLQETCGVTDCVLRTPP